MRNPCTRILIFAGQTLPERQSDEQTHTEAKNTQGPFG